MYFNLDNFTDIRGSIKIPTRGRNNLVLRQKQKEIFRDENTTPEEKAIP
jgi:hypothetical protein